MRLTKAVSGRGGKYLVDLLDIQVVADKLGLLEDIEEDLGIDLVKLLSAKEIWYKGTDIDNKTKEYVNVIGSYKDSDYTFAIQPKNGIIYFYDRNDGMIHHYLMLRNYGKTWAFAKEELKEKE